MIAWVPNKETTIVYFMVSKKIEKRKIQIKILENNYNQTFIKNSKKKKKIQKKMLCLILGNESSLNLSNHAYYGIKITQFRVACLKGN